MGEGGSISLKVGESTRWEDLVLMLLTGEFFNKVDDKGRLMIPARLRTLLASSQVVLTKGIDGRCLSLFSPAAFEKTVSSAIEGSDGMQFYSKAARQFTRLFIAPSQTLDFDANGRINLPASLRSHAELSPKSEAVILGMGSYIEIWNRDLYEDLDSDVSLADLAEELASQRREK